MQEIFVGRRSELETLRQKFEHAAAGRGGVVLLAGEPGIGKTAIADRFASDVHGLGGVVLAGASFEGGWQRPLSPWVEAIGSYVRAVDMKLFARQLGPLASVIAPLVPEMGSALPSVSAPPSLSPEEERFRLFDSIARVLMRVSEQSPALVVLEDLHWAAPDSLALLTYVARVAPHARLLLLGTYRRSEVQLRRHHPLSQVLAELARARAYERISLGGLAQEEVSAYLAAASDRQVSAGLVSRIHEETAGNPFYIRELFRHLTEEGKIGAEDAPDTGPASELGIPESVKEVLARRLARLSAPTNRMLRAACAFTAGFEFAVLQVLAELTEPELLESLDEALATGLLVERRGPLPGYDFAHALVRHALEAELNADRRARLHRRVAEALEDVYAGREEERAAELAAQYHASRGLPGAERGLVYALVAAEPATGAAAFERAAALLGQARDLASQAAPATQADVLRRLAIAQAQALMLHSAHDTARDALAASIDAGCEAGPISDFVARVAKALAQGTRRSARVVGGADRTGTPARRRWAPAAVGAPHASPRPGGADPQRIGEYRPLVGIRAAVHTWGKYGQKLSLIVHQCPLMTTAGAGFTSENCKSAGRRGA